MLCVARFIELYTLIDDVCADNRRLTFHQSLILSMQTFCCTSEILCQPITSRSLAV